MRDRLSINAHIRVTEDIIREVRALSELENRPVQDQFRVLILLGLQLVRGKVQAQAVESGRAGTRDDASLILPAPPIAAKRRVVTQRKMA